jgi:hypothetical protein
LANDGLADAVDASFESVLRDQKVEYSRVAFSNSRVEGRWLAGYRRIAYRQSMDASYYALVPTFPAFVPPLTNGLPALAPLADLAHLQSRYEGRGVSAGLEVEAPLYRDKLKIEASLGISVLLGRVSTEYRATNSFYSAAGVVLEAPYTELGDYSIDPSTGNVVGFAASVKQEVFEVGLKSDSLPHNTQVLEASLGARWSVLDFMDVFFGFRAVNYGNVAVELRPKNAVSVGNAFNTIDASQVDRSVAYEGFYGGVGFRF